MFQDDYKLGVGPDENSKELDGKVLYSMEGGLRHGRTPIGNGAVDKEVVLAAAQSKNVQQSAAYRSVLEENEQLRETNGILIEENGVNRELILVIVFFCDEMILVIVVHICLHMLLVLHACILSSLVFIAAVL